MARLFVAVWPSDEVAADLTQLHRKDQRGVRFVSPENWHITLRFLGEADPDMVGDALDQATLPSCVARLGPAVDVFNERALVVPVAGVDQLAAEVVAHTGQLGDRPRKRFSGHLTLARLKPHASMPRALGALVHGEFAVEEIALVRSTLDPDGARYETIATWPIEVRPPTRPGSNEP